MASAEPSWTRLEPLPRDRSGASGLRAEVHDPLWLLARQLQMRELRGEDAGSPVMVVMDGAASRLTRYRPGTPDGTPGLRYDGATPLEAVVEAEPPGASPMRFAALAGLHFLRLLAAEDAGGYADAYLRRYRLGHDPAAASAEAVPDPATQGFLSVLAGRAPDGAWLYRELAAAGDRLPAEPRIAAGGDTEAVGRAAGRFRRWYRALAGPQAASAWVPPRLEYQLAVAAPAPVAPALGGPALPSEVVLTATEYDQGRLDWNSFDLALEGMTLGAATDTGVITDLGRAGLPAPVFYRGMPAPRFWEFEDAAVDFGDLTTAPEDLSALLLIEFATVYGNDHFVVPVDLGVGSICMIQRLVVLDTFGRATEVRHVADTDAEAGRPGTFRLFELGAGGARSSLFLLPPALAQSLDGAPLEDVRLLHDEGANMAWAVEATAARSEGFPVDRAGAWRADAGDDDPPPVTDQPTWRYRLRTAVPDHWLPLVPVVDRPGSNHLELGELRRLDGSRGPAAWGRILGELAGVPVPEEEVTRAGARITRAWQYARWLDGRQHSWIGRRREPGSPAGDSGLRFDVVDPTATRAAPTRLST